MKNINLHLPFMLFFSALPCFFLPTASLFEERFSKWFIEPGDIEVEKKEADSVNKLGICT